MTDLITWYDAPTGIKKIWEKHVHNIEGKSAFEAGWLDGRTGRKFPPWLWAPLSCAQIAWLTEVMYQRDRGNFKGMPPGLLVYHHELIMGYFLLSLQEDKHDW